MSKAQDSVEAASNSVETIQHVFATYEQALNTSDLPLAMSLYIDNGVFMMPHHPTSIGKPAITIAYKKLFEEVDHYVKIAIDDVNVASGLDWAFVRTTTTGSCTIRATRESVPDAVQQLWVLKACTFKNGDKEWRIASYSFSPTGPSTAHD